MHVLLPLTAWLLAAWAAMPAPISLPRAAVLLLALSLDAVYATNNKTINLYLINTATINNKAKAD